MGPTLRRLCDLATAAATLAARGRPTRIDEKTRHDYVTDMDWRIEAMMRDALEPMFGVPVIGEESCGADMVMPDAAIVLDPLDGTANWIAGLPYAAVSVAYVEHGKSMLAAVAAIDITLVYAAEAGAGAWRNGDAMHLAGARANTLFALSTGLLDRLMDTDGYAGLRGFGKLRNLGSQALQLCAVGQGALAFNASWEARLWDDAAGRLIATEAGATYRALVAPDLANRPAAEQHSLCAHPEIAEEVDTLLRRYLEHDGAIDRP